jgi:NTE family protein
MIDTLCLGGGGIKALSYLGALNYLEDIGYIHIDKIKTFSGTSSGSIVSFLFNIGYSVKELIDFSLQFDFTKFEPDINCNIFFEQYGIDSGDKIMTAIKTFLEDKYQIEDITFIELYNKTNIELSIVTTNYTLSKCEDFNYNNTPDVSVLLAIRMSISVPFFYTPVEYNNCYYVDGGLTKNFPLSDFEANRSLGLTIINKNENKINSIQNYLHGLISITIDSINMNAIKEATKYNIKYNYIEICCKKCNPVDFKLDKDAINLFLEDGKRESEKYYKTCVISEVIDELINKCLEISKK